MNCRRAKKLIPFYLAPHGSWLKPEDRPELIAHLAMCDSCREEYEEASEAVRIFQEYGSTSADTQALLDSGESLPQESPGTLAIARVVKRVASIAAVIAVSIGIGALIMSRNHTGKQGVAQETSGQRLPLTLCITENGVPVSASTRIMTGSTGTRELLIGGKHRLVMNTSTSLVIEPMLSESDLGC